MLKKQKFIEGGIYTTYNDNIGIYCGQYYDSYDIERPAFIELKNYTGDYERKNIEKCVKKIDVLKSVITLEAVDGTAYTYGYLGKLSDKIWKKIDRDVKYFMSLPIRKN